MSDKDFGTRELNLEKAIEVMPATLKDADLSNFSARKNFIQKIISDVISNEKFTVNINLEKANVNKEILERLLVELKPRLREIGANLCITNNSILTNAFIEENNIKQSN